MTDACVNRVPGAGGLTRATALLFVVVLSTAGGCKNSAAQPLSVTGEAVTPSLSACQKADRMWNRDIVPSDYGAELPALTAPGPWDLVKLAMPSFTVKSLTAGGDELEQGRRKLVHAFGAEARFRFVANRAAATPYTGIFRGGAECVIGRLSVATKPTDTRFVPALALKVFVDGNHPSVNLQVMNSIDGQEGYDFFEKPFSNVIPPTKAFATRLIANFFARAARRFDARDPNPGRLTVEHLADIETDGSLVAGPTAPYQLLFAPRPEARALFKVATIKDDFRITLGGLPVGMVLYDVYALERGETVEQERLLGELVLSSRVVASRYGDEKLYFQHNMERRVAE